MRAPDAGPVITWERLVKPAYEGLGAPMIQYGLEAQVTGAGGRSAYVWKGADGWYYQLARPAKSALGGQPLFRQSEIWASHGPFATEDSARDEVVAVIRERWASRPRRDK